MSRAELVDGRIGVWIDPIQNEALMALPGSRWSKHATPQHSMPLTFVACLQLRGLFGAELEVGPDLAAWSVAERDRRIMPSLEQRLATGVLDPSLDPRLKPFQNAGVVWLRNGSSLVCDGLGSGKTVQACAALKDQGLRRGIVVCPKSVLFAWAEHLEEWAGLRAVVVHGTPAVRRKQLAAAQAGDYDVIVIGWNVLNDHSRVAGFGEIVLTEKERTPKELDAFEPEFVIADEAHIMRAPRNVATRAAWNLADLPSTRFRLALTGTPMDSHLDELWAIMRFVEPAEWPVKTKFTEWYCEIGWNQWGGRVIGGLKTDRREEFFRVLDPRYRAMPKSVVLPELPPVRGGLEDPRGPLVVECDLTPKQRKAYESLRERSVVELDSGILVAASALARANRVLALCSAYGDVEDYQDKDGVDRQRLHLSEPSCKLDALEDLVTGQLDGEEALVVFTVSRRLAEMAQKRLEKVTKKRSLLVIGGQTADERHRYITEFQAGKAHSMVVTIASGGTGTTLTRARVAVFLQREHSYIKSSQAEGRVHRIGSEVHDQVTYIDVVAADTIERKVLKALAQKQEMQEVLSRPELLREFLAS